jgi:hypothetical protein
MGYIATITVMIHALLLFCTAVLYRIAIGFAGGDHSWAWNFAPVAAIALCGPALFPRRVALVLPLAVLAVSDVILNLHYGAPLFSTAMLARYVALGLIALAGLWLRSCRNPLLWLGACAGGSTVFYLITNTASWTADPGYAKTLAGFVQALTTGLPGYLPTWMFFRNTLVGDFVFTLLIALCLVASRRQPQPVADPVRA